MAREATLIVQKSLPVNYTCANGTGIEKGALLTLSDPNTAAAATDGGMCAGVAFAEKIASDGVTKVAVLEDGDFKFTASGSIAVGDKLAMANGNYVKVAPAVLSGAAVIGYSKETASTNETFLGCLRIGG